MLTVIVTPVASPKVVYPMNPRKVIKIEQTPKVIVKTPKGARNLSGFRTLFSTGRT